MFSNKRINVYQHSVFYHIYVLSFFKKSVLLYQKCSLYIQCDLCF